MDRDRYISECLRPLNDTKFNKLLHNDITTDIQKRILKYTERMNRDTIINEETKGHLIQTDPTKPGRFYILPKVHKQCNPGRPIVSSNPHPTERISQFVDHHLWCRLRNRSSKTLHTPSTNSNNLDKSSQKPFLLL